MTCGVADETSLGVSAAKFEGGMSDALDKEIVIDEYERGPISQMLRYNITRHSHHT